MMSTRYSYMAETLPLEVTEVIEIEVSMMIEDVINVELWETLPKLSMEHVTEIGPGHQGAEIVMIGFVGLLASESR